MSSLRSHSSKPVAKLGENNSNSLILGTMPLVLDIPCFCAFEAHAEQILTVHGSKIKKIEKPTLKSHVCKADFSLLRT